MNKHFAAALVLVLGFSSSSFSQTKAPSGFSERMVEFRKKMNLAKAQIEVLNKAEEDECVGDGECEEIELGENRCGGPQGYVVYSKNNPNAATIKTLAGDYTAAEKGLNGLDMGAVTCGNVKQADPKCVKNRCIDANNKKKNN